MRARPAVLIVFAGCAVCVEAHAAPSAESTSATTTTNAVESAQPATSTPAYRPLLAPLPKAPRLELPAPDHADSAALDELLSHLISPDEAVRDDAARELLEVQPRLVPAIARTLDRIAESGDRDAMKSLLEDSRKQARDDARRQLRASGQDSAVVTPDYLHMLLLAAEPNNRAWQDLVRVVAMSRMLCHAGGIQAARVLIGVYVRFGEFLRVDTQLQLEKMGGSAVAALIEARHHRAEKIAHWAERQLDGLGKAIPGEAVNTTDYQVLADVLRAYGRVRDPDAARIVISFANSERTQVREAARQAIALMGDVASWQLRDAYETVVGKKPPRDWTWERTARELFGEFDHLRLAQVYDLYEQGQQAQQKGDYDKSVRAYDKVLNRSPAFEHRADMSAAYLAYAKARVETERDAARTAASRAERLATGTELANAAESLRLTLEGEALLDRAVADQTLFRRALELDASNRRAATVLAQIQRGQAKPRTERTRYASALAIAVVALLGIAFIALRRRGAQEAHATAAPSPDRPISEPDRPIIEP